MSGFIGGGGGGGGGTGNVTAGATLTNHALVVGQGTTAIATIPVLSDGQLPIGRAGLDPLPATLTAGANITLTNAAGSITIASTGGGGGGSPGAPAASYQYNDGAGGFAGSAKFVQASGYPHAVAAAGTDTPLLVTDGPAQGVPVVRYERVDAMPMVDFGRDVSGAAGQITLWHNGTTAGKLYNSAGSLNIDLGQPAIFRLLPSGNDLYIQNTVSSGNINFTAFGGGALSGTVNANADFGVPAGKRYLYNGQDAIKADTTSLNWFFGPAGNLTATNAINVGIGPNALVSLTSGRANHAMGYYALSSLTSGTDNVAIGAQAMWLATGSSNVGIGSSALASTTGSGNVAVGWNTMAANTSGVNNMAIGTQALGANTTGSNNSAIGFGTLQSATTADANTAIGFEASFHNTTGLNNCSIGYSALFTNTTGSDNTAVGVVALATTTGDRNAALGRSAGQFITIGTNNVAIGYNAALSITTGSNNLILGDSVDPGSNQTGIIMIGQGGANRLDYHLSTANKWTFKAPVVFSEAAALVHTNVALTNGAGSATGTLTNAPAATNPTKWIPIDDNGVTRYIPAW